MVLMGLLMFTGKMNDITGYLSSAGQKTESGKQENGKKQDLSWDGVYIAPDGTKFTPNIWFMIKAQEKLTTFKRTAAKVIPIVVIVVIVALIYLWFRLWCIREDKRMEALYGNKEQKKLANNNKKKKK
mgnify:FL=1